MAAVREQPKPILCTPEEAALYLHVGRTSVYRLLRERKVPVVKIGNRTLLRYVDLDAFCAAEAKKSVRPKRKAPTKKPTKRAAR